MRFHLLSLGCPKNTVESEGMRELMRAAGHEPLDLGTSSEERVDYPDYARKVGDALQSGDAERGVLICGSGVGACVAANKIKGIFAGLCHDTYSAHQGVEHDDMNVLCLGGRIIGSELAKELIVSFLGAEFIGEGRYLSRVEKVRQIEAEQSAE